MCAVLHHYAIMENLVCKYTHVLFSCVFLKNQSLQQKFQVLSAVWNGISFSSLW